MHIDLADVLGFVSLLLVCAGLAWVHPGSFVALFGIALLSLGLSRSRAPYLGTLTDAFGRAFFRLGGTGQAYQADRSADIVYEYQPGGFSLDQWAAAPVEQAGGPVRLPRSEIFHVPGLSWVGCRPGCSPVAEVGEPGRQSGRPCR